MNKITVNDIEYQFKCIWVLERKVAIDSNAPALQLELFIRQKKRGTWKTLNWNDFKGTYFAEKLCDYIKDIINKPKGR